MFPVLPMISPTTLWRGCKTEATQERSIEPNELDPGLLMRHAEITVLFMGLVRRLLNVAEDMRVPVVG